MLQIGENPYSHGKFVLAETLMHQLVQWCFFRHVQAIKDQAGFAVELGHFFRDAGSPVANEVHYTHGKAAQSCDVLWAMACSNAAAIFIKVSIDHVVTTVLNDPMPTIDRQHLLRIGL